MNELKNTEPNTIALPEDGVAPEKWMRVGPAYVLSLRTEVKRLREELAESDPAANARLRHGTDRPNTRAINFIMGEPRFVRVWTTAKAAGRTDQLTDATALQLLQEQYGEDEGLRHFVSLATGKSGCASAGPSSTESYMIEYRGPKVAA